MSHIFQDCMTLVRKATRISTRCNFTRLAIMGKSFQTEFSHMMAYHHVGSDQPKCVYHKNKNKLWRNRMEMGNYEIHQYRIASTNATNKLATESFCAPTCEHIPWVRGSVGRTTSPLVTPACTLLQRSFSTWQVRHFSPDTCMYGRKNPQCYAVRRYSQGRETVEKKLLHLMEMWEVEDAAALLRQSVEAGVIPHANVVLSLQQQLANLGEVERLLELHDFLKEHNLTSDTRFFHCLKEAYYNSGRISEGVAVLRLLYHRKRVFADVDVFFTLLTVMVIQHFPNRLDLVLDFVKDLKGAEIPVLEPEASLWKCYMMAGRWSEADDLLLSNEGLRPLLPRQVARICQGVDRVQLDDAAVLNKLLNLPFIRQKLRVFVAETLITHLMREKHGLKLLKCLKKLKTMNLPLHADKLSPALDDLKRHLTPQYDDQLQELRLWCDSLQGETKD